MLSPLFRAILWLFVSLPWRILKELLVALPRYILWDCAAPRVSCPMTPQNKEILDCMPCLCRPYFPTPWLPNGTMQTLYAMLRTPPEAVILREALDLPTSVGTTVLDWVAEAERQYSSQSEIPIVLICPGTSGRSDEPLVRTTAWTLTRRGWRVAVSNRPGAVQGGVTGDIPDIHGVYEFGEVVEYVHGLYPRAPLFGLGVSIGANVLTRYLANAGMHSRLAAVLAVSPILDVREHAKRLARSPLWDLWTSWQLRGIFYEGQPHILQSRTLDHDSIRRTHSLEELDNSFSRRVAGHRNLDEFYRTLRTQHLLKDVAVPMMILHSKDDPVVPVSSLPYAELSNNCNIITVFTRRGGHAAFCQDSNGQGTYVCAVAHQFLDAVYKTARPETPLSDSGSRTRNSYRGTPTQSFDEWNATWATQRKEREDRVAMQIKKHTSRENF